MDVETTQFLAQFTPRLTAALAEAIDHDAANVDSPFVAAAITTADANLSFAFVACTRSRQREIQTMYQEEFPELVEDGDNSWWPDEWGFELQGPGEGTNTLPQLRNDWNAFHEQRADAMRDEGNFEGFAEQWEDESLAALVAALGSDEVRSAFARVNSDPILVVTETDGGADKALRAFETLNADRDDEDFHASADYWRAEP